jgi:hypothetical protein
VETLTARKAEIAGLAVASDERIEACILYYMGSDGTAHIMTLRSFVDDGGGRLKQLHGRLRAAGVQAARLPKVHPGEFPEGSLETLGFRPAGGHTLYATSARSS